MVEVRWHLSKNNGDPEEGYVLFTPRAEVVNGDVAYTRAPIRADLDSSGLMVVDLLAGDDPGNSTTEPFTYLVEPKLRSGSRGRLFDLDVPYAASESGIDLKDVAPVSPATGGSPAAVTLASFASLGDARYERVFPVPDPTGEATKDTAAILAATEAARAAGGGIVKFRPGTYELNQTLPVLAGVSYIGAYPVQEQTTVTPGQYLADGQFVFAGGTVLHGDGSRACFEANATDLAESPDDFGATAISGVGIHQLGMDNFTYGVHIGAANVMGLVWSEISHLYVRNCSQWGIRMVNFLHVPIRFVETALCQGGQYYGANSVPTTMIPGNSTIDELYHITPQDTRDRRLTRGIVFEGIGTTINELRVGRIQANCYNKPLLSESHTFTSGSANVTVPDGTKYAVGMPVSYSSAGFGFSAGQVYVVASVAGNTITLAPSRNGSEVTASGSGSLTGRTYGFPNVELTGLGANGGVSNSTFDHVDVEGQATSALYLENTKAVHVVVAEVPSTALVDVVGRNMDQCSVTSMNSAWTDFDANSTSSMFTGNRHGMYQRLLRGFTFDSTKGVHGLQVGAGQNNVDTADLQSRQAGFLYPAAGMGQRIYPRDSGLTLSGLNAGRVVFAGSSATTFTLPTILTDTSNPGASHVGMVFDVVNVGAGTLTINTNGTQLFNKVTGKTGLTVAPQNGLELTAAKDNGGNLFWLAKAYALA